MYRCDKKKCGENLPNGVKCWCSNHVYKNIRQACSECKTMFLPYFRSMENNYRPKTFTKSGSMYHHQNECEMCQCKKDSCRLENGNVECVCKPKDKPLTCPEIEKKKKKEKEEEFNSLLESAFNK